MNKNVIRSIIVVLSIIIGFLLSGYIHELTLPVLKKYNYVIGMTAIGGQLTARVLFAIGIGLIPIFYFVLNQHKGINFKLLFFLITGGIMGLFIRLFYLIRINESIDNSIPLIMSFGRINFGLFIMIGVISVGILGFILTRMNKE